MRTLRTFWFGDVDLAPVAVFRILYGAQLFNWFWQLFPNIHAFFSDEGIFPRHQLIAFYPERITLLNAFSETWQVALVCAFACAVALALMVGWHTRLACLLSFVLLISFQWRNPLILDGSDLVFRFVPLWLMFTSAGDLYSIDARLRTQRPSGLGWAFPIRILELQIAWIYLATGIEKLAGTKWLSGTATYYALQLEHTFGRWWARPIAMQPLLVQLMSWGTLAVELGFLPLAMLPSNITRLIAAIAAAGLHLGILFLMNVGNFPVIMLSALVLFLPPTWIRRSVERLWPRATAAVLARLPRPAQREWMRFLTTTQPPADAQARTQRRISLGARGVQAVTLALFALFVFATAVPRQLEPLRPSGDLGKLVRTFSLDERWDMFSPDPAQSDGWMLGPARLADGTTYDLYTGGPVDNSSERYSDPLYTRWAKVYERIANSGYGDYRLEYGRYFCRARNFHLQPGQSPLDMFDLFYIERVVRAPEEGPPLRNEYHLWNHKC
jgi:hypothetical protein